MRPVSEQLFEQFCDAHSIPFERVATGQRRTPDYVVRFAGTRVTCEIKQINPNADDLKELQQLRENRASARYHPNRLRDKLKDVSAQLKAASEGGEATMLIIYDNTPFKGYTDHADIVQAMFGRYSISVSVPADRSFPSKVSAPFFGGNRGMGPGWNTAVSAIAVLEGGPIQVRALRVYHNVYAAVRLEPSLIASLPVSQVVLPDTTNVSF